MTGANTERTAALEAAATLLAHAMDQSHAPVETLGNSIARLAQAIARPEFAKREELARELADCIVSLQFHDRMLQQLVYVRNYLPAAADGRDCGPLAHADLLRLTESQGSIELF